MGGVPLRALRGSPDDRPPGEPRLVGYLYLLPAFVAFAAFVLYPLYNAARISLYDYDGITVGTWTGLSNYSDVFTDPRSAWISMRQTVGGAQKVVTSCEAITLKRARASKRS